MALIWADWQSCSASGEELLDPVRSQYKEAFAVVRCTYRGRTYSRCVYIWVDKDFAIARGLHQGYPKKLGSIHQTRPHPYGPPRRGSRPAGPFGAHAGRRRPAAGPGRGDPARAVADQRLRQRPPDGAPPLAALDREGRAGLALDELIESGAASFEAGPAWRGDADAELFESPTEELARLEIREPSAATTARSASSGTAADCWSPATSGAEWTPPTS